MRPRNRRSPRARLRRLALFCLPLLAGAADADTAHLTPIADNTLFEDAAGAFSNGAGQYLFAGSTNRGLLRRALLKFDLSSIPPDATVNSVSLTMQMSRTSSTNAHTVALHAATRAWGEGASDATDEEGFGARTEPGDATWTHAFDGGAAWAAPGGDFSAEASANLEVSTQGPYTWDSTARLVADVQGWVQNPTANFGWALVGDETASGTAKRFNSSENTTGRPTLTVEYTPGTGAAPARAGSASLAATKDNSLYEDAGGALSNGAGQFLFVGRTGQPANRRALLAFHFTFIPTNATVTSAALTLHLSRTSPGGTQAIRLHKMLADWGEGTSDANSPGGLGTAALPGDATWLHAFADTALWATPGGDFAAASSATLDIENSGSYTWGSTDQLVADVQAWVQDSATNFGWVLIGNESASRTAKRFDSRENITGGNRPRLDLSYTYPNGAPTLVAPIADQQYFAGQDFVAIDLAGIFADADGDTLTYSATSADPTVASVQVNSSALSIMPLTPGATAITLVAADGHGGSSVAPFAIAVRQANNPPTPGAALPDLTLPDNMPRAEIDLSTLFTDADGDSLSYTATSADTASASVSVEGQILRLQAKAYQNTAITITATDPQGGQATLTFAVTGALSGDFNEDEKVDFSDFFIFADNFGLADFNPATDLNGDGAVSFDDFFIFADHFGNTSLMVGNFGE